MLTIVIFGLLYVGCGAAFYAYLLSEARPMPNVPDTEPPRFAAKPKHTRRPRISHHRHAA